MLVAQCDHKRYYLGPVDDYNQGMPSNCFGILPTKIDRDKTEADGPGWYNGWWPRINLTWTEWEYEKDYRGQTWYQGSKAIEITELGPLPEGVTEEPVLTDAEIAQDIQQVRAEKHREIEQIRQNMWDAGVWHKGHLFQSRQKDRDNVKDVFNLVRTVGWVFGDTYAWRSANDIMVPFTYTDVFTLNLILTIQNEIIYNISWKDKDERLAALTKKSQIKSFVPTYLDTYQIKELIEQRMAPYAALLSSLTLG
jgi:hypothetical protein